MKAKLFLGLAACCFLVSLILVVGWTASKSAKAQSQEASLASLSSLGGTIKGLSRINYKMIQGSYYQDNGITYLLSFYTLFNSSPTNNITLGAIYVLKQNGLNGPVTTWSGLAGTTIPPLGSSFFYIAETGVAPVIPGDPRGAFLVIVTFSGEEKNLRLTGATNSLDSSGNTVASISIGEPF